MFDPEAAADLMVAMRRVVEQPRALATSTQTAEALRSLGAVRDVLDGQLATLLHQLATTGGHRDDGSPTAVAWATQHLRLDTGAARKLVAAGRTLDQLPQVAEAARAGRIRLDHVAAFTTAITKLGHRTVEHAQPWLLDVAVTCPPAELRGVIHALAEVVDPDKLDDQYDKGMARRDINLARTTGGYHLTGFLDPVTGAKLRTWLTAASAPTPDGPSGPQGADQRPAAQRRIDALEHLISSVLEHGMPTDRGIRPQIHITVDHTTLAGGHHGTNPLAPPATLSGYGAIGPKLLSRLLCDAVVRTLTTDGHTTGPTPHTRVLDVGRTHRLATPAQRIAVSHRQHGRCATPGCGATYLQIHHVAWWDRDGGTTDLDNLVGLCPTCHTLTHLQRLTITPDGDGGFTFTRRTAHRMLDHHRINAHHIQQRLTALRHALAAADHRHPHQPPARPAPPQPAAVRITTPPTAARPRTPLRT